MVLADITTAAGIAVEGWRLAPKPVVPRCSFYAFEVYDEAGYVGLYSSWTATPQRRKDLLPLTQEQYECLGNPPVSFP